MKPWLRGTIFGAAIIAVIIIVMIKTGDEIVEPEATGGGLETLAVQVTEDDLTQTSIDEIQESKSLPRMLELGSVG